MLWAISAAAMGQDGRMERIFFFPFSTATATMIGKGGGGGWAWLNSFLSAGAPKRQLIILGSSSFSLSVRPSVPSWLWKRRILVGSSPAYQDGRRMKAGA